MDSNRLRAPKEDGAVLVDPPLDEAGLLLAENAERLARWDHDFQGRRAGRLRAMARGETLHAASRHLARFGLGSTDCPAPDRPLVVTGHQPELFHPGVWIKNFAAAALGRDLGACGLNLIVDNDIPKGAEIRVPRLTGARLGTVPVDFDAWSGEAPYEDWRVGDEARFASFGARVREALGGLVADPLIDDVWPAAMAMGDRTDLVGLRLSAARREIEGRWGASNAEVALGAVCETEAFGWFACHILAHLPRFRDVHNDALNLYRMRHGIRSKNHPVPALSGEEQWNESPFWAWRRSSPRRRPLMARQDRTSMTLRIAGESAALGSIRLSPDRDACCAVEDLRELTARGVRIRTRALTTTMFARLLLGDLFIHGIGGAKYDELGDAILRGFFGFEPPGYLTLSMTRWLGLGPDPEAASLLRRNASEARRLIHNPDRALTGSDDPLARRLVEDKSAAIAAPTSTRRQRASRFRTIRRLNSELAPFVLGRLRELNEARPELELRAGHHRLASGREWSYVLHSRSGWLDTIRAVAPSALATEKNPAVPHKVAADGPPPS